MRKRYARAATALLLSTCIVSLSLTGCESIEKETGLNKDTQTGAASGAAFGGIVAALADANPALIAASIILGGVTGGAIGNYLGKDDAETHAENHLKALDTLGQGQSSSWRDAKSGNSGSTTVHMVTHTENGSVCKSFTEVVRTGAKTVTEQATACKAPGGDWRVQKT
jgi:surface antigen